MSVNVIDTIKPKNGGSFPVVEAVDVAVSGSTRLDTALAAKANAADLAAKADKSELTDIRTTIALKANQSSLDALNVIVSNKAPQSTVDALSVIVEKKADKKDYSDIYAELDTKASIAEMNIAITGVENKIIQGDTSLQEQIDQIEISASAESVVAPEVAAARVGVTNTYQTLKQRLDAETEETRNDIALLTDNYHVTYESGKRNMADINTVVEDASWKTAIIECAPGQVFHIKGSGGSANQLYMFAREDGTVFESAGSDIRWADYHTVTAPLTSYYLVLNSRITEEPTYIGSCIVNSFLRDEIDNKYNQLKTQELRKVTQEDRNVSAFNYSSGNTDWYWFNEITYPAGYIDHFTVYGTDNSIGNYATIAVYDATLGKFLWKSEKVLAETKTVEVPCNIYFEHEIYVCVSLPYLAHNTVGDRIRYAKMWEFALWEEGAVFDITWEESTAKYRFAVECWYNDYINMNELQYSKQKNKLFVAGDSITAGYPYTSGISRPNYPDPDIKWGAQVGRKLGFDVTFGAQTGAGWISQPYAGSEYAISIADKTNFANYDTVAFAFGTNDYGANIPLGELTDIYPTNATVCGSINYVLNKIYTDNPKAVVILSSPINRSDRGTKDNNYGYGAANTQGYTLLDLVNKMKELCEANGICFIDNSHSPFNKFNLSGLLMDNLHPNPTGYKILGAYLADKIANYVTPYTRNVLTAVQK